MANSARVSVVIPMFNAARFVGATLQSVLAQRDVELDIVVVDDGSTDGSADLVAEAFPSVRLLRQGNQGVAAARNSGIAAAEADWIAFLDADDLWLPGKLASQFELLKSDPISRMCYTAWKVWSSDDPAPTADFLQSLVITHANSTRWNGASGWIYPQLLVDCVVWTSTVLVHRSVLDEVGLFDRNLRIGEDYDLWIRASRVTPILRVCAPLALYRMHPASITKGPARRNYKAEVVTRALKRWGYGSPDGSTADRAPVKRNLCRSWTDFAGAHISDGDASVANRAALMAIRYDATSVLAWKTLVKSLLAALIRVHRQDKAG